MCATAAEIRDEIRVRYLIDCRESAMDSLLTTLRRRMVDKGKYVIYDVSTLNTDTKSAKRDSSLKLPRAVPVPLLDDTTGKNDIEDLFRDMEKAKNP